MRAAVYDAGIFVAAERNERSVWAEHRVRLSAGIIPLVPANIVAQASRSPPQAQLPRFLRGCGGVCSDDRSAHRTGSLLGRAKTADVVAPSGAELAVVR